MVEGAGQTRPHHGLHHASHCPRPLVCLAQNSKYTVPVDKGPVYEKDKTDKIKEKIITVKCYISATRIKCISLMLINFFNAYDFTCTVKKAFLF
jgi:hypothetical protein